MSLTKIIKTYKDIYFGRVQNPVLKREDALALIERKMRERGLDPQIESFELISRQAA